MESRLCLSATSLVVNSALHGIGPNLEEVSGTGAAVADSVPAEFSGKIASSLWTAIRDQLKDRAPVDVPTIDANPLRNGSARISEIGEVEIVVHVLQWSETLLEEFGNLGLNSSLASDELLSVQGWASPRAIGKILAAPFVKHVELPDYGVVNTGDVTSAGDVIHRANEVRSLFAGLGIDGTGIKVGVISDGADHWSNVSATDDLPSAIAINPLLPGSGDEGTAMLEIIHDLAPGAELFFSSGIGGTLAMIESITWLVSQGVDIIVDDLSFFAQPYFQDGVIANAAASAVASGVIYVSSAGNQALDHYQAPFNMAGFAPGLNQELHEFAPDDAFMGVAIAGSGGLLDATLQWSDPFGASGNDYNLYLLNQSGQVVASSQLPQTGTQNPFERIVVQNNGPGTFIGFLAIGRSVGTANRELELFVRLDIGQEYSIASDAVFGHQAASGIITAAAINASSPGQNTVATYSNHGPSTIYTDFGTQTSTQRVSLNGAGIDGVETKVGQLGHFSNPFFGTSAAAPHVAGIAALLLQMNPALSPAGVAGILAKHAVDVLSEGYDAASGFGRFDALAAATSGVHLPKVTNVSIGGSGWDRPPYSFRDIIATDSHLKPIFTAGTDTIQIDFSEHVVMNGTEFTLFTLQDSSVAWNNFNYNPNTHVATWTFSSLPPGKYRIELTPAVVNAAGNPLDGDWNNIHKGTPDNFDDDPKGRAFLSGDGVPGGTFSFFFSLLPGDSNQDGRVTEEDANVAIVGDINGDGKIDSADVALVNSILAQPGTYAKALPLSKYRGDYTDNERVGLDDYVLWKMTFGSTDNLAADGNGNGIIDAGDFNVWRDHLGWMSAWYTPGMLGMGSGSAAPVVNFGTPPQVMNVTISGSNSMHDPYSFASVAGSGEQLRTVPVGGADTISITFSEDVNIVASDVTLVGLRTAVRPTIADFTYDIPAMTATWRFEGWAFGDQYLISLSDAVTDVEGTSLDGEWTNPTSLFTTNSLVSTFPSGNGNAGGDFNFVFTVMTGDANLDGIVDQADLDIFTSNWGTSAGKLFTDGDFNGDGGVNFGDLSLLSINWGKNFHDLLILADLNGDGKVDDDDLAILFDNWENGLQDPSREDGDLNGDGVIDIHDLDLMFAQWGLQLSLAS